VPGGAVGAAGTAGGTSQFEFGVDPSLDPELAMVCFLLSHRDKACTTQKKKKQALRMSMEEEAARQAAAGAPPPAPPAQLTASVDADATTGPNEASTQSTQPVPVATVATDATEEAILQQTLALSENRSGPEVEMTEEGGGDESMTEEDMIARAIEMSMHPEPESEESEK
jgi:26S proteasome regulatory subunit N10